MTFSLKLTGVCCALLLVACGGQTEKTAPPSPRTAAARVLSAAPAPYIAIMQRLYVGYFGRPADPDGLAWYVARLQAMQAPADFGALRAAYASNPELRSLIDSFAFSQESRELYPEDNGAFIDAVYANVFGREPDADGRAFWKGALDRGEITRANAVLNIVAGARGEDSVVVALKAQMATEFTDGLNTPDRINAYQGAASFFVVRAMLTNTSPYFTISIVRPSIERTVEQLTLAYQQSQQPFQEVQAGERRIALVATASQLAANRARLEQLAAALSSDLSARDPGWGPNWKVDILQAAPTVKAIRQQLRGYRGTLLIGDIPVPTHPGYVGGIGRDIDPYRTPDCPYFRFKTDGNGLVHAPELYPFHPDCRNGQFVALLHGRSAELDISEVANKLDQMIAYHRSSASANFQWSRTYRFISAVWAGGLEWKDVSDVWKTVPLYSSGQFSYTTAGNASEKLAAFKSCLASNAEMCALNAHGAPQEVQPEGPGIAGEFYSRDTQSFTVADVRPNSVGAKYVSLVSCSTQDLGVRDNLGTTLLMSGNALLTHGMKAVVGIGDTYERELLQRNYRPLALGATFAEAFAGDLDYSPIVFQGDPWITMRPAPAGDSPKLVIDGKRYHGGEVVVPMDFPDSVARAKVYRTFVLSNRGKSELKVHAAFSPLWVGPDSANQDALVPKKWGVSMMLEAPVRYAPGGLTDEYVIKPGESMPLTYSMEPYNNDESGILWTGGFQGQLMLVTNDPAAPRIVLELHGNVRSGP